MRSVVPPSPGLAAWERSSDDVEEMLRLYFRSQLPSPWPELKLPAPVRPARPRRPLWSSRAALAATIAFLLMGSLALSAAFRNHPEPSYTSGGAFTATGNPFGFSQPEPASANPSR